MGVIECDVIQQVTFDAVCKIFDCEIGNTAEVSECIGVIAQLALIGVDEVCSPDDNLEAVFRYLTEK